MEPGYFEPVEMSKKASRRKGGLLILASFVVGLILLGSWMATPVLAQIPSPTAVPDFDLAISKTSVPLYFSYDADNRYVISVYRTNDSTVTSGVSIIDQMPTGVTINNVFAEDWNCTISIGQDLLSCSYNKAIPDTVISLPPILVDVTLDKNKVSRQVINTAQLIIIDNNLTNNSSTITTLIEPIDLEITKTHSPEIVIVDPENTETPTPITYTITISNNGELPAEQVSITDTFPQYITNIKLDGDPITTTKYTWTEPSLSGVISYTITADLREDADGKTVTNKVEVSSSNADYDLSNNTAETSFLVGGLNISKIVTYKDDVTDNDFTDNYLTDNDGTDNDVNKNWVYTGEIFTYTITVENISDSPANTVIVYDTIPEGIDVVDTIPDGVQYTESTRLLRYSKGTLSEDEPPLSIQVIARANSTITETTTITNSARVTWYPQGSTIALEDFSDEVPILVVPQGALEVTKSDGVYLIRPEQVLTYTVTVSNVGSLPIPSGIKIRDVLPGNTTLVNYYKDTLPVDLITEDNVLNELRATLNQPLDPDEEVSFRVVVQAKPDLPDGTFVNNRVVATSPSGIAEEVSESEAIDTNEIDVVTTSGMSITMSVSPTQAKVGDQFTFKIDVKNTGQTKTDNIVVNGKMQSVLDYVSSAPAGGTSFSVNSTARTYTWTIGTLLAGNSRSMTMVWKVNSSVTASNSYDHAATLTWNTNKSLVSNTVKYRVTPSSTLPGTGFGQNSEQEGKGLGLAALILAGIFALLGLACLGYGIWARKQKPAWANWFMLTGVILMCGGGLFGVAAYGFQIIPSQAPQQLAAVSHATQAPENRIILPAQPTDFVEVWNSWPTPTPESLPDYAIPEPPEHLNQGPDGNEPDSSAMTRIIIPTMGLDTVVKYVPLDNSGWLIGGLKQEVAWMGDTSWPGLGSNTGLAGHVDLANGDSGPFWNLGDLKPGDKISVFTEHNQYIYTMRDSRIVPDSDLSVISPSDEPQLTLITCAGWDPELKLYLLRLVVFAGLEEIKPLPETAMNP